MVLCLISIVVRGCQLSTYIGAHGDRDDASNPDWPTSLQKSAHWQGSRVVTFCISRAAAALNKRELKDVKEALLVPYSVDDGWKRS
jgi:hypothetical protein